MRYFTPAVVMVTHENAVIEAGLRHILGASPEFEVQASASSTQVAAAKAGDPDLVVLDHESGIAWARGAQRDSARTNVMVVAMTAQEADVRVALEAGIRGYVLVGCSEAEIVNAARGVAAGRRHLCSEVTLRIADSLSQPALTLRESEVLSLVCRGLNNKEVGRSLDISVGTVKSHMRGLLAKLGARCRTEALWIASQRGLITRTEDASSDRARTPSGSISRGTWVDPNSRVLPPRSFGTAHAAA